MPALRVLLLLRGAFGVLFALSLLLAPASTPALKALGHNGTYALGDGLLALAMAFALSKVARFNWLFALALADALIRLVIGAVAYAYPDIEARILGSVAFFGTVVTACIALGAVGVIVVLAGRRGAPAAQRGGGLTVLVISACTLLLGAGLLLGFGAADARRMLVGIFALAVGLCLLASGFRLKNPPSTF